MILVDANLLLYAYHPSSERHRASREWLESILSGSGMVWLAWVTLWAFVRISSSPAALLHFLGERLHRLLRDRSAFTASQ